MNDGGFASSALIGHMVSVNLMIALLGKGIISVDDVREIADQALLLLERHRHSFPEDQEAFDEARSFLDGYAQWPRTMSPSTRASQSPRRRGRKKPPSRAD
jgi:hypothetical protein